MEVSTDFAEAGWFRLRPSPGLSGSAVILGHVDSYRGPAVFSRLRAGDEVEVSLADGAVARVVVTAVPTYPKEESVGDAAFWPDQPVSDHPRLRAICSSARSVVS